MTALASALNKAQAKIEGAKKDSTNLHFKSTYADLASVWDACRDALHANGFSVVQGGDLVGGQWVLRTTLLHVSGETQTGYVPLLNGKGDMQGLGSAFTYARRYGLAAMVGVCPEDDDGNAASETPKAPAIVKPEGYDDWLDALSAVADEGTARLRAAWGESPKDFREFMPAATREALKAKAAKVPA